MEGEKGEKGKGGRNGRGVLRQSYVRVCCFLVTLLEEKEKSLM